MTLLEKLLAEEQIYVERVFPYQEAGKIQLIRESGQLLSEEYTEDRNSCKGKGSPGNLHQSCIRENR